MKANASGSTIATVAALLFFLTLPFASAQINLPSATILSINYPSHVTPNQTFAITIETNYSTKSPVDVGIWNTRSGAVVQSFSILLPVHGNKTFDFKLTAPSIGGEWQLIAITRVWWQDAWYLDPNGGSKDFSISVSDTANLVLSSEGTSSTVGVDGLIHSIVEGEPEPVQVTPGFHVLAVPPIIQTDSLERFVFVGWSDGVNSNPRRILVNQDMKIASVYRTEYYLSVKSDVGQIFGEGWYERGSNASFAVTPRLTVESWFGLLTEDYHFAGWSGDVTSKDALASITMDGPKTVEATWAFSKMATINPVLVSTSLYIGAFILAARVLYRHLVGLRLRTGKSTRTAMRWIRLLVPLLTFIVAAALVPPVHSQLPGQADRSTVTIGDASWYYWKQSASDTCVLWLGGGVEEQVGGGNNQYWINPYEYESFGTLRFLQDISKYYCVLALEKGSYKSVEVEANRTIYQEPYQIQSQIIDEVHGWIMVQGYAHTYLVGYSVGAQVAATLVSMQSPNDWTSPDGLILITPFLSNDQIQSAPRTRTSVLVVYGGDITPEYLVTGREFYNATQSEGWHGTYYLHKEFHVIPKMGHEVWTVLESGAYDTQALHILINFVEGSKALQIRPSETIGIVSQADNYSVQHPASSLTDVKAPGVISLDEILVINADLAHNSRTKDQFQIIAVNTRIGQIESVTEFSINGSGPHVFNLLFSPPFNSSELHLEIIVLYKAHLDWLVSTRPFFITTKVASTVAVTLETTLPNSPLVFDGATYEVSGPLQLEVKPGLHTIQSPRVIGLTGQTRAVFTEWEDGTPSFIRQVDLRSNATIVAIYRKQYFVGVASPYGQVYGGGWYDENSTATILVQPPMISETGPIFRQWEGDSGDAHPRALVFVASPKALQAGWDTIGTPNDSDTLSTILPSVIIFTVFFALNLRKSKSSFESLPTE